MSISTGTDRVAAACVRLDGTVPSDEANAQVGGKSAATDRLVAAGFPVPPSAAVTTTAYRRMLEAPELAALVRRIRAAPDEVERAAVDEAFLRAPLDPSMAREIVDAAAAIGGPHGIAARSSATVEDLEGTSFAGQYRSFLGLRSDEEVLRAVRLVWASLWYPAPVAYRQAHGVSEDGVAMGVLLMRMVPAVTAGVAFTTDPGGAPGVRVEAVEGLGEALVSGEVTPEAWIVPRPGQAADRRDLPELATKVADAALRVESSFGRPMDIEWAWDGAGLWIVQARPITVRPGVGDGFDTPVDEAGLTTAGVAEMLPGVLPPLVWSIAGFAVEEALRRSIDGLAALPPELGDPHRFIRRVRGRAALDLDLLKAVAKRIPGGSADEVEQQYFGTSTTASAAMGEAASKPASRWSPSLWIQDLRVLRARRAATQEAEVLELAEAKLVRALPDIEGMAPEALRAYRGNIVDLVVRAVGAEVAVAAAAAASFRRLELTIAGHLGDPAAASWAQRLTTGVSMPVPRGGASMSVVAGRTWQEAGIEPAVTVSKSSTRRSDAGAQLEATLQALPKWRATRIMTGQVVDVRVHVIRRLASDAVTLLGHRERTKAVVLSLGGELRRIHLELGRRLVATGSLPKAEDIDLLDDAEVTTRRPLPTPVELGRRRRWVRQCEDDGPLPERFVGVPAAERPPVPLGDTLHGMAGSGGRYTARARVVRTPTRTALREGEVLVAAATDAGWSPLFLTAGAIVVERGGPLSHAAIVARELGVPAVLDVAGATERLDGRVVTVDGDLGVVVVHDDAGARA